MRESRNGILLTKEMRTIPALIELEKNIVPLLVKRNEILAYYTPASREYQDIEGQISALRGEIKREILKAIRTDELELETSGIRQASLKSKIEDLQKEANALSEKERIAKELEREVELLSNNYMLYATKAEDARIYTERKRLNLANVSIADRASLPVKPAFPNRLLMLVLSIMAGLVTALIVPFVMEFTDHSFKTSAEAEELLSLPVVCSFPELKR